MATHVAVASRRGDNYFPGIDGLRAIAVLSVIIYHLHESFLPGGFVGVDVFFCHIWLCRQHVAGARCQIPVAQISAALLYAANPPHRSRVARLSDRNVGCDRSVYS